MKDLELDGLMFANDSLSTFLSDSFEFDSLNTTTTSTKRKQSYELKKERAKVSRKEVNDAFDQLVDFLEFPRNVKGNRAKVIIAAVDRLRSMETKIRHLKRLVVPKRTRAPCDVLEMFLVNRQISAFLDAKSLTQCSQVSKRYHQLCLEDACWTPLCMKRWNITEPMALFRGEKYGSMYKLWQQDAEKPEGPFSSNVTVFADGKKHGVSAWVCLGQRSNCRTTRTVAVGGKIRVAQIVELRIIVQNQTSHIVCINPGLIHVSAAGDKKQYSVLEHSIGTQLHPRIVVENGCTVYRPVFGEYPLGSSNYVILSVFVECPKMEFESDFLLSAEVVQIACRSKQPFKIAATVRSEAFIWQQYQQSSGMITSI